MPKLISHQHNNPTLIRDQLTYATSLAGRETARAIIACKLRNGALILSDYRQSRERAGSSDQAAYIGDTQNRIARIISELSTAGDAAQLLLMEARAARAYWNAVRVICRQPPEWRRIYPHARDSLNILLNTGYTALARSILTRVISKRLLPEVGILHGTNSGDALVYDLMECFRQPTVDAAIMPVFSRKKRFPAELGERSMKHGFWLLSAQKEKRYRYFGRCERLSRIMEMEILRLRASIISGSVWKPYEHQWGHHVRCKQKSEGK